MAITASMVKELRDATGAGMMDAKKALTETEGDFEAAVDWLRTKGLAKAAKKSGRVAAEGLVAVSVQNGTGVAVGLQRARTDSAGLGTQSPRSTASARWLLPRSCSLCTNGVDSQSHGEVDVRYARCTESVRCQLALV